MRCAVVVATVSACGFAPAGAQATLADAGGDADLDAPVVVGDWWNPSYGHRRPIVVTANDALPAGMSIEFGFQTDKLVSEGEVLANAADWRVVRHLNGGWVELDRWIDDAEGTGWNGADTHTWFKLPVALVASASDGETYVYYGSPLETTAPLARMDHVFLFGDDFESSTLTAWSANAKGENFSTQTTDKVAGALALKISPGNTVGGGGGVHRDLALPAGKLRLSAYLREDQTNASLGIFRTFAKPYAMRQRGWNDNTSRLFCELDSTNKLHNNGSNSDWFSPYNMNTWRHVEMSYDQAMNKVIGRVDNSPWSAGMADNGNGGQPLLSISIDGEGQGGTFEIDNYTIRLDVTIDPVAVVGEADDAPI